MTIAEKDMKSVIERHMNFPLSVGIVIGSLGSPDINESLRARGITNEEIDKAYLALLAIAKAFYRDPK